MRSRSRALVLACTSALAVVTLSQPATAATSATATLSTLAALPPAAPVRGGVPAAVAVPGITLKTSDSGPNAKWHELTTATGRGYCFATSDGGPRWTKSWGLGSRGQPEEVDLDRFVEKDGKATLERTRIVLDPKTATVTAKGRSSVELQELVRGPDDVVAWAYRDGKDVVILARHAERGVESRRRPNDEDGSSPFVSAEECPFAGVRLDARKPEAGAFVQLSGTLPAKGKGKERVVPRFIIDASLSKVARDPEPLLAIRVRVRTD